MARKRIALKPDEWPTPDREAWRIALVPGDLLEPGGLAAKWAPSTQSGVSTSYGRWLAWLTSGGLLDVELAPAARVTPKAVAGYVGYLREQHASSSAVAYLAFLVMALQAIAPDRDWAWLQRIVARLKMQSAPAREKRPRLQDTDDLLAFGVKLMAEAEPPAAAEASPGMITWQGATQYRDGLMIALLALRPFRRKNFCAMEIGRHLVHRKGGYRLLFEAEETKNHRPLEIPFPAVSGDRSRPIHGALSSMAMPADRPSRSPLPVQAGGTTSMDIQDGVGAEPGSLLQRSAPAHGGAFRPIHPSAFVPRLRGDQHRHRRSRACSDHRERPGP